MYTFVFLSLRETPNIARKHRISKDSKRLTSWFLSVQVSEAYVAIGRIKALDNLILRFLEISRLFHTVVLSLPKAVEASDILRSTSPDVVGNKLPRNTKLSTCSTSFPSNVIGVSLGDMILHLAPFIFMPHFRHASSSCFVVRASLSILLIVEWYHQHIGCPAILIALVTKYFLRLSLLS